jgi:oxalate decarboxylase/phosphoglucose isomerase-like protein (cupin superfamily)
MTAQNTSKPSIAVARFALSVGTVIYVTMFRGHCGHNIGLYNPALSDVSSLLGISRYRLRKKG